MADQNQEILFAKTLEYVKQVVKDQSGIITKDQLDAAFAPLNFQPSQMELVYDYLKKQHIGVEEAVDPEEFMTSEEISYLDTYLKELEALPKASDGETEAITLSAMAGDKAAMARLTEIFLPRVAEIARLYAGQGALMEDLIGEGNVALTVGVTMLGAMEHAAEAQGMLVKLIMDAMEDYISSLNGTHDENQKIADRINKVNDQARALSEELLRKVSVEELALESGIPEEEIREAVRLSGNKIPYLEGSEDS
ncbi:MAG: hypothetical protein LUC95_03160 [Lachnospiraceae bacterium]|nr:hypothetical protein [Lachnospiraceae bacterium]